MTPDPQKTCLASSDLELNFLEIEREVRPTICLDSCRKESVFDC